MRSSKASGLAQGSDINTWLTLGVTCESDARPCPDFGPRSEITQGGKFANATTEHICPHVVNLLTQNVVEALD
jgi:hypothetical protein